MVKRFLKELDELTALFIEYSRLNQKFTHDIWIKMNLDNYEMYLQMYDLIRREMWRNYCRLN